MIPALLPPSSYLRDALVCVPSLETYLFQTFPCVVLCVMFLMIIHAYCSLCVCVCGGGNLRFFKASDPHALNGTQEQLHRWRLFSRDLSLTVVRSTWCKWELSLRCLLMAVAWAKSSSSVLFIIINFIWAGKLAPSVKGLLPNHEDLSSDPQQLSKAGFVSVTLALRGR